MATRKPKALTATEIKQGRKDLAVLGKQAEFDLRPFKSDVGAAIKKLSTAKKEAARLIADAEKAAAAAETKLNKAVAAAAKGAEKRQARAAELDAAEAALA